MIPKKITWEEIREEAEKFRKYFVKPTNLVPVPIEEIVEFKLGLIIEPINKLKQKIDIDGFLSNDLTTIFVDNDLYKDQRYENRIRFTLAHEVGHFILHKEEIQGMKFRTTNEWLNFRENFSEENLSWFEQQANEFAGRLLVPKQRLIVELEKLKPKITEYLDTIGNDSDEELVEALSRLINNIFCVSERVIYRRIKTEKILNELN